MQLSLADLLEKLVRPTSQIVRESEMEQEGSCESPEDSGNSVCTTNRCYNSIQVSSIYGGSMIINGNIFKRAKLSCFPKTIGPSRFVRLLGL
jgi:hypothetical protein